MPANSFDSALTGILADAEKLGSMDAAVDGWLDRLDENFIPFLGARIENSDPAEPTLPQLTEAMGVLQKRSQAGFERARDQLQSLLSANEVRKLDQELSGLVRRGEIDAGFFYVLFRNIEDAKQSGDEEGARLLTHIHTRVQEELEKKTDPALALLHKLTRMNDSSIRFNLLRNGLVPQKSAPLPDGGELPLKVALPAEVEPMDFAKVIDSTLEKIVGMPMERVAIEQTAEEIRQIAKEARLVISEAYDAEVLNAFTDALTPAFTRALPPKPPSSEPAQSA